MTRFTRGKTTHQRIEGESTPWKELKDTPAKDDTKNHRNSFKKNQGGQGSSSAGTGGGNRGRFNNNGGRGSGSGGGKKFPKKRPDRRGGNGRNDPSSQESANFTPLGVVGGNPNVRGQGSTKSVKIFGNFWVGEEDARRLQGMAKKLKQEGVSRKEILDALQGERRKAEKDSKKRRDKTCFNCRQFGHVLSDCPSNANTKEDGDGASVSNGDICFKCGSTEHTSRFCKRKSDKFSFAKCFVCSKSGHIARQCPSNQKGIYPSGGSCDTCGAVTHLKKDCPDIGGGNKNDDPESQVGRMTNPFVSMEYEELPPPLEETNSQSGNDGDEGEGNKKQKCNKSSKRNKRKWPENQKESVSSSSTSFSEKAKPNPAKKRKVVKF